jgi:hypothetical protein
MSNSFHGRQAPGLRTTNRAVGSGGQKRFKATGLNDHARVDRTDRPFFSFDGVGPREIDDAIRVTKSSKGAFKLEVAIVDGAQLDPDDAQTERAIRLRQSTYTYRRVNDVPMLSTHVIRAMELRGGRRRATVVTQQFDADAQPLGAAEIVPSWIGISNRVSGSFLGGPGSQGRDHDMVQFAERWLGNDGKPAKLTARTDNYMVATCMNFANKVITEWAEQEGVTIPLRVGGGEAEQVSRLRFVGPIDVETVEPPSYVRANFTAPLRVAAHLITHQQVGAHLAGIEVPYSDHDINVMAPELYVKR